MVAELCKLLDDDRLFIDIVEQLTNTVREYCGWCSRAAVRHESTPASSAIARKRTSPNECKHICNISTAGIADPAEAPRPLWYVSLRYKPYRSTHNPWGSGSNEAAINCCVQRLSFISY